MALKVIHKQIIPARLSEVGLVSAELKKLVRDAELGPDVQMKVELAVCEAVNNAIVHALKDQPEGTVEIESTVEYGRLEVFVRERGTEILPSVISNVDQAKLDAGPDCSVADLPTSGRGLHMIDALCSDWSYHSTEGVNTFHLIFL